MKNVQIIILAAGKGTRMESDLPKALTPLAGKPFIDYVLSEVQKLNPAEKPIVVVGHKKEEVIKVLRDSHRHVVQDELLGTGHAVKITKAHIGEHIDTVVVLFADQPLMKSETIKKLIEEHVDKGAILTMATADIGDYSEWRRDAFDNFGKIVRDENGNVLKIVERKNASIEEQDITEVNPAYFVFQAEWMWQKLDELKNENAQGEYYLIDLPEFAFREDKKIHTVAIDYREALGANTKAQLEVLEKALKGLI